MTNRKPQISATVSQEIYDSIDAFAKEDRRSISEMVALLLEKAIKEKTRNRKGGKKDNTGDNTTDLGSSDSE